MPIIAPGIGQPTGFSIGRVGKTLNIPDPMMWKNASYGSTIRGQGGDIVVEGMISGLTPSQALVVRDQFLGYQDNWDEPIVPVVVASEPRLTGYYQVTGVQVDTDPTAVGLGILNWTVGLQPVNGFTQPMLESVVSDALLTNVVGAVVASHFPVHGVPAVVTEYGQTTQIGSTAPLYTRSSADGNLSLLNFSGTSLLTGTVRFALTPANFYVGGSMIEQGSPLQPVVGRMMTQNDTVNWRISNALVRVTPNATPGKIDVSHWKGAAWAAVKTYKITGTLNRGLINGWTSVTILRNSVEECILRLGCTTALNPYGPSPTYLDISLRRADRIARCYLTSSQSTDQWSVFRDITEAATAISYASVSTGGIRATANDADSNRYILLSYQGPSGTPTNDLVNGGITQSIGSLTMDIGISSEVGGSGAATNDTATSIANQYLGAVSETQHVIAR